MLVGVGVASLLGLPFCVASVVLSINHVQYLKDDSDVDDFLGGFSSIK